MEDVKFEITGIVKFYYLTIILLIWLKLFFSKLTLAGVVDPSPSFRQWIQLPILHRMLWELVEDLELWCQMI